MQERMTDREKSGNEADKKHAHQHVRGKHAAGDSKEHTVVSLLDKGTSALVSSLSPSSSANGEKNGEGPADAGHTEAESAGLMR